MIQSREGVGGGCVKSQRFAQVEKGFYFFSVMKKRGHVQQVWRQLFNFSLAFHLQKLN